MKLDAGSLLRGICSGQALVRGRKMGRELGRVMRRSGVAMTPLVVVRLEEFLVLYHVVQGLEDKIRDEGLFAGDDAPAKGGKPGVHPHLDQAIKCRDRLNKCVKDIEGLVSASGGSGEVSLAELLSPLKDERKGRKKATEVTENTAK